MRILFVCTGNLCRSPLAERLAVVWARDLLRGSPEHATIEIGSAGVNAVPGRQMDGRSAHALRAFGGDPAGFQSRCLDTSMADQADLVVTMSRLQRREVLEKSPRGLRRTFTLLEAADLMERANLAGLSLLPVTQRARELGLRLDRARSQRASSESDDVVDPIGRSTTVHSNVAATIARALRPLADVLFASVRPELPVPVEERLACDAELSIT